MLINVTVILIGFPSAGSNLLFKRCYYRYPCPPTWLGVYLETSTKMAQEFAEQEKPKANLGALASLDFGNVEPYAI